MNDRPPLYLYVAHGPQVAPPEERCQGISSCAISTAHGLNVLYFHPSALNFDLNLFWPMGPNLKYDYFIFHFFLFSCMVVFINKHV